jgi:light-regulated signal transduction histidine kinase (bacteriophytochrome)
MDQKSATIIAYIFVSINFVVTMLIHQVGMDLFANAIKFASVRNLSVIQAETELSNSEYTFNFREQSAGFGRQYLAKRLGVILRLDGE